MPVIEDDNDDPRGFAQMPRWLQRSKTVSKNAKLVYLALSSRADRYGRSHPSHELLAAEASCSVASVKRALDELKALEVVTWKRRKSQSGQTSNEYTIGIAAKLPEPVDNSARPVAHGELPPRVIAQGELHHSSPRATERETVNELTQSSSRSTYEGPVDNFSFDDDENSAHIPTPLEVARAKHQAIDYRQVREALAPLAIDVTVTDTIAGLASSTILKRAAGRVGNPTRFVLAAIANDPFEWQAWLLGIEAELARSSAESGGNPF